MKKFVFLVCALALATASCGGSQPAANTSAGSSPAKPAASNSTASASPKTEKKAPSTNPVPADWIRMYDDVKGYEFKVPQGTDHKSQTVDGVDVYLASVPAPYELSVAVVAFKDKNIDKDELLKRAQNILASLGDKDVKVDAAKELNDDYSLANYTAVDDKGKPQKGKILVATDVTDNYIVLIEGDSDKFSSNEKTIDEIWGSFGMYSGGFSGNS
jgi:hypothetical protein